MKMRFQADADLNQIILLATVRRESSIDFQTAEAAGLAHRQDRDVLVMAARGQTSAKAIRFALYFLGTVLFAPQLSVINPRTFDH